jgi:AhpD family alkylhydroperoxidase
MRTTTALQAIAFALVAAAPALAGNMMTPDEALADIAATLGGVPTFVKALPPAALPGAWAEEKAMEFSDDTALSAKEKALISLAVAAQIPCDYCIWSDTEAAKAAGATAEEIAEAVTIAGLTRHWSTVFNGLQIDKDQFKREMSGDFSASN